MMNTITVYAIVLIRFIFFCYCEKSPEKPDLSDEKRQLSDEKSEEANDNHPLFQIDKKLEQELQNPTAPDKSFEVQLKILKNLVEYKNWLEDICTGIHKNETKKLNLAQILEKQNGPKFLRQEFNEEKLKQVYNWDDDNLELFSDSIQDIKSVLDNITIALKQQPSPWQIYFKNP